LQAEPLFKRIHAPQDGRVIDAQAARSARKRAFGRDREHVAKVVPRNPRHDARYGPCAFVQFELAKPQIDLHGADA
jgi:hypothetical protein